MTDPVIKTIEVACSPERAFEVYVDKTASWWPLSKHTVSAGSGEIAESVTIEGRLGGEIYEIHADGSRNEWGIVDTYDHPNAIGMSWHPGSDASKATHVLVEFEDLGNGHTRVTLTHSGWEILGADADERRNGYNNGWVHVFEECFVQAC